MCVLQRLLTGLKSQAVTNFYWATLAVTFIAAFTVTFTECHPFNLYWQVVPDPGTHSPCSLRTLQITKDQERVQKASSNSKSSQP